jgi:hypothetical protein
MTYHASSILSLPYPILYSEKFFLAKLIHVLCFPIPAHAHPISAALLAILCSGWMDGIIHRIRMQLCKGLDWLVWYDYSSTDSSFHPLIPFHALQLHNIIAY